MSSGSLRYNESGRVAIFFLISAIPFIFLIALIYNTSQQSIRKIQVQGAADEAAIAGGTQAARDLNEIAANNNAMAEVLGTMILLRSTLQTAEVLGAIFGAIPHPLTQGISRGFNVVAGILRVVDLTLSTGAGSDIPAGAGWRAMNVFDEQNRIIKAKYTEDENEAEKKAIDFAKRNGADLDPYARLFAGESPNPDLKPILPADRGNETELVDKAEEKVIKPIDDVLVGVIGFPAFDDTITKEQFIINLVVNALGPQIAPIIRAPAQLLHDLIDYNLANLRGGGPPEWVKIALGFVITDPLGWPNQPPRPMLLTDDPDLDSKATMDTNESEADLSKVRKYLQYLAVASGEMQKGSAIGGERFLNVAPYQSLTYAEADVYNPDDWSLFKRNWKVKQAYAIVLNQKFDRIAAEIGIGGGAQALEGIVFANNH